MSAETPYALWTRDDTGCAEAIRSGKPVEVELSAYGENDFVLEFLLGSGLWTILTSMAPDRLKKGNGKPWRALNGVEVLRELARVERISQCGKILRDARLMMVAGFNAEAVQKAREAGKPVVDPETLSNHLGRISPAAAAKAFGEHVGLMRRKRWIRGGTYAADAHEIIVPYGRTSERLGKVGEKYGYKLVLLLNVTPERERAVGFVLAPLHHSERALLKIILRGLQERFGPVGEWMKTLVLDRGYWGAKYLLGLHRRHGMDLVTRAQHEELGIVKDLDGLVSTPETAWQWREETHSRLGDMAVRCAGVENLDVYDERQQVIGQLSGVVAEEYDRSRRERMRDEDGRVRPRFYYVTTLPTAAKPPRIRGYYGQRWGIENQGFRELTQEWALDCLAGRRFNTLNSRIAFALMLYNAERLLRMKHPGPWQEERERLRGLGERNRLSGPSLVAYTPQGQLGFLRPPEYERLIVERERDRLVHTLREGLAHGETLERMLQRLQNPSAS
jgi:hypothetical protein